MGLHNTQHRFGSVAMTLHWLIALCVIGLLAVGLYMTDLDDTAANKFQLYQLHKSFGITVLCLMVLRLAWRWIQTTPPYPAAMPAWERAGAKLSHWGFYAVLIAMPLSGWASTSASKFNFVPTIIFGQIHLPHISYFVNYPDRAFIESATQWVHFSLGMTIITLLVAHVGAALKHHFVNRDDVLTRMLPGRSSKT